MTYAPDDQPCQVIRRAGPGETASHREVWAIEECEDITAALDLLTGLDES